MIKGCKSSTSLIILTCIGEFQVIGYLNRIKYGKKIEVANNTQNAFEGSLQQKTCYCVFQNLFQISSESSSTNKVYQILLPIHQRDVVIQLEIQYFSCQAKYACYIQWCFYVNLPDILKEMNSHPRLCHQCMLLTPLILKHWL